MKKITLAFVALLCAATISFAQKTVATPATPAKKVETAFPREKFDPARDPKADLDAAIIEATKSGKRIILDIGGEWCSWCRLMDRFLYENKDLGAAKEAGFVWVKINMSPENENHAFLDTYPAATGYPHLYILDAKGTLLHSEDTSLLEAKETYDLAKFTAFLNEWSPSKP